MPAAMPMTTAAMLRKTPIAVLCSFTISIPLLRRSAPGAETNRPSWGSAGQKHAIPCRAQLKCVFIKSMANSPGKQTRRPWQHLVAFLLLCFLLAIGAARSDLFPSSPVRSAAELEREALALALLAAVAGLFSIIRRCSWPRGRQLGWAIAIGLGLFAAPAVLVHFAQGWVSAFTRVTLFSLTPVIAVVLEPHINPHIGAGAQSKGGLLAALAAVAGALCIFPVDLSGSVAAAFAVAAVIAAAACIAATNCLAVRVAVEPPGVAVGPMAAIAGAAAALGLLAAAALTGSIEWQALAAGRDLAWTAAVTLPGLALLFWLMPRMTAPQMTTRFVVAPLIAVLFGIALDRPTIDLRTCAGLFLIAAGAGWLLYAPAQEPDSLSLNR